MSSTGIIVTIPSLIRSSIYSAWISGYTDKQTLHRLRDQCSVSVDEESLLSVIQSQYRLFDSLEPFLRKPKYFIREQCFFPMDPPAKIFLVEHYYSYDASVMRELVGRRLVGKTRRDLDDISERTTIPLVSCRRQFDNLRAAIFRAEESPNDLHLSIRRKFLLSETLTQSYVALVFLNHHQIRVVGHEALEYLPLQTAIDCAHVFIKYWTVNATCLAFNPRLTHILRDLQSACVAVGRDGMAKEMVQQLKLTPQDCGKISKLISKTIGLGSCLLQPKRLHDLFVESIEEIINPLRSISERSVSLSLFFQLLLATLKEQLPSFFATDDDVYQLVQNYIQGLSQSTIFLAAACET